MLSKKYKSKKLRNLFLKTEYFNLLYKFFKIHFFKNSVISNKYLSIYLYNYKKKKLKLSRTKLYNRCLLTNRSRGIISPYNLSRLKLREFLQFGIFPGYSKAVW
jgi:ribosomal protein S14